MKCVPTTWALCDPDQILQFTCVDLCVIYCFPTMISCLFRLVLSNLAKDSLIQLGPVPAQLFYCYTEKFKLGSSLSQSVVFHLNNKGFVYDILSTVLCSMTLISGAQTRTEVRRYV